MSLLLPNCTKDRLQVAIFVPDATTFSKSFTRLICSMPTALFMMHRVNGELACHIKWYWVLVTCCRGSIKDCTTCAPAMCGALPFLPHSPTGLVVTNCFECHPIHRSIGMSNWYPSTRRYDKVTLVHETKWKGENERQRTYILPLYHVQRMPVFLCHWQTLTLPSLETSVTLYTLPVQTFGSY